jgi:hypothetical protein
MGTIRRHGAHDSGHYSVVTLVQIAVRTGLRVAGLIPHRGAGSFFVDGELAQSDWHGQTSTVTPMDGGGLP